MRNVLLNYIRKRVRTIEYKFAYLRRRVRKCFAGSLHRVISREILEKKNCSRIALRPGRHLFSRNSKLVMINENQHKNFYLAKENGKKKKKSKRKREGARCFQPKMASLVAAHSCSRLVKYSLQRYVEMKWRCWRRSGYRRALFLNFNIKLHHFEVHRQCSITISFVSDGCVLRLKGLKPWVSHTREPRNWEKKVW